MFYSQKHCTLKKGAMTFYTFTQLYGLYLSIPIFKNQQIITHFSNNLINPNSIIKIHIHRLNTCLILQKYKKKQWQRKYRLPPIV